jgi:hypothetical protein
MPALLKYLVLLALFLLASHANALTSLSLVAGDQVLVIRLIQLWQPMTIGDSQLCFLRFNSNEVNHAPVGWQYSLSPGSPPDSTVEYKQGMTFYL